MKTKALLIVAAPLVLLVLLLAGTGCSSNADVASSNISKAAEQFKVYRQIVFINGITDKLLFEIDGYCSVETTSAHIGGSVEVTCKTADGRFFRNNLGLSDNVTYLIEQRTPINVSDTHYRVRIRPGTIIPNFTG